jgi:DNA-binding GntR family transcriptional regulator
MFMKRLQVKGTSRGVAQEVEAAQDAVYGWLKQHIVTLPRNEGTFLTEAEVCQATGTSRTPVREALLRLETDGFLKILPKKGAYVPPITEAEVEAVMQARGLVEDWCVRQVAASSKSLVAELERILSQQRRVKQTPVRFIERDREFHRLIVRTAGNPFLAEFYESLRDRQLRMGVQAIAVSEARIGSVLAEHAAIVDGIRSGNPERAAKALQVHLSKTLVALHLPSTAGWTRSPAEPHAGR